MGDHRPLGDSGKGGELSGISIESRFRGKSARTSYGTYQFMAHSERRTKPVYALVATQSAAAKLKPAQGDGGPGICPCGPGALTPERASMSILADRLSPGSGAL